MTEIHDYQIALIAARPEMIYAVLAEYTQSHPAILPRKFLREITVEQGGKGTGTIVRVRMEACGVKREYRLRVEEPGPGSMLQESILDGGPVTTFTVQPLSEGQQSEVSVSTKTMTHGGLRDSWSKGSGLLS